LSDTGRHTAMLRRCLLSSGSRVRILPGAPGQRLSDHSNARRCLGAKRGTRQRVMTHATGKRRGHGEDLIYWDESRKRYIGAVDLAFSPAGTRIRKKVSGKTKVEVRDKLRELHKETEAGLRPRRRHTVGDALEDWLAHGVDGLSERTVTLYRGTIVKALNEELGNIRLTELTASNVQGALSALAGRLSTRTVQIAHNVLVREQCE
jgi:hypothetical protein